MLSVESRCLMGLVETLKRHAEDSKREAADSSCEALKNYSRFCLGQASGFELAAKWLEELVLEV